MSRRSVRNGDGRIVIVKRNGGEGSSYPVGEGSSLSVGADRRCDIRVAAAGFPPRLCVIVARADGAVLRNLSDGTPTRVNDAPVAATRLLHHGDKITINDNKFRWEYDNTNARIATPTLITKHTRRSVSVRNGATPAKLQESASKRVASESPKTRQIAVVRPQRRSEVAETDQVFATPDRLRTRTEIESQQSSGTGRSTMKRTVTEPENSGSQKRKKPEKVEKLESPILDKHKRAALMLMTGRSPINKSAIKSTQNLHTTGNNSLRSSRVFNGVSHNSASRVNTLDRGNASANVKTNLSKVSRLRKTQSENKNLSRPSTRGSLIGRMSKIPLKISNRSINASVDKRNVSRINTLAADSTAVSEDITQTQNSVQSKRTSRRSIKSSATTLKMPIQNNCFNISGIEAIPDVRQLNSSLKDINNTTNDGNSSLKSFISQLASALHVVNDPDSVMAVLRTPEFRALNEQIKSAGKQLDISSLDSTGPHILEIGVSKKRTSNRGTNVRSSQAALNSSPIISPKHRSPTASTSESNLSNINSTPNLSKLFTIEASTPLENKSVQERVQHYEALRLSKGSTQTRKSGRISSGSLSNAILEKKRRFENSNAVSKSEPRKQLLGISKRTRKTLSGSSLKALRSKSLVRRNNSCDVVSDASDATDVNAPKPDNEIVITPKSTIKPVQEILKEKHSTAKKPISKKTVIDHLTRSPEIVKELFKSPVKRKLSQSMKQYSNSSSMFEDVQDISMMNSICNMSDNKKSTSLRSSKACVSFNFDNTLFGNNTSTAERSSKANAINNSIRSTRRSANTTSNSSTTSNVSQKNIIHVATSKNVSPQNELEGIKKLLKSPKSFTKNRNNSKIIKEIRKIFANQPKIELIDFRGVKKLFNPSKLQKSPNNDLTDVKGVKRLLKTPSKIQKSPRNSLGNVEGVKQLFSERSTRNNISESDEIVQLFSTPGKITRNMNASLRSSQVSFNNKKSSVIKATNVPANVSNVKIRHQSKHELPQQEEKSQTSKLVEHKLPRGSIKAIKSPKNDLTDVRGVRRLLRTPIKKETNAENNSSHLKGIKRLFSRQSNSGKNNTSHLIGIAQMLSTPKNTINNRGSMRNQKDFKNLKINSIDNKKFEGVKKIVKSPKNDLTDVRGVRKLLRSPVKNEKQLNASIKYDGVKRLFSRESGKNVSDLEGVAQLLSTPIKRSKKVDDKESLSKSILSPSQLSTSKSDKLFDSFVGKSPQKTYSNSKKNNLSEIKHEQQSNPTKEDSLANANISNIKASRSRRQATIDKTNYSIEVSKVWTNLKASNNSVEISILGQSTPAATRKVLNETNINIKQISPILPAFNAKESPKLAVKRTRGGKPKVLQISPEQRKTTRSQKSAPPTKKVDVEKKANNVRGKQKNVSQEENTSNSTRTKEKKKVHFASDVKLKSSDDNVARSKRSARKTNMAIDMDRYSQNTAKVDINNVKPKRGKSTKSEKSTNDVELVTKKSTRQRKTPTSQTNKTLKTKSNQTKKSPVKVVVKRSVTKKPVKKVDSPKKVTRAATSKTKKVASFEVDTKKKTTTKKKVEEPIPAPRGRKRKSEDTLVNSPKKVKVTRSTNKVQSSPKTKEKTKTESKPVKPKKPKKTTSEKPSPIMSTRTARKRK